MVVAIRFCFFSLRGKALDCTRWSDIVSVKVKDLRFAQHIYVFNQNKFHLVHKNGTEVNAFNITMKLPLVAKLIQVASSKVYIGKSFSQKFEDNLEIFFKYSIKKGFNWAV